MSPHNPSGTVIFLFTDIEGSTKLAQEHADKWEILQKRHNAILRGAIESNNGYIFQIIGDAFCAAFHTTEDAINAAVKSQMILYAENWGNAPIRVRMGIHAGKANVQEDGQYIGYMTLSRVERLMTAGHGGQILLSSTTEQLTRDSLPKDITLRDLGERRLKDMPQSEHIFQLVIPNLQADFPSLRTLEALPNNLPAQLTSFIGREKELADVKNLLTNTHLLTLIGPGGTGKTRLSLQAATDLLETFSHGAWLVELAPISDSSLVASTTAAALNLPAEVNRPVIDMLCDYLREKELLIVLDNCEHLVEACARIVDRLLRASPKLRIVASSREALGITGEVLYRVPSLGLPDLNNLSSFESLKQYESVQLFVERAASTVSTFRVTNNNAPAIAQICHRLDGIPLAIELAAAKVSALSVDQIAKRLDDRFRLLTGGNRIALEHHQTLRATLDWSYNLLSSQEQILLNRLSIFVNGWTLEAAESVCSDESTSGEIRSDDVLNLLEHLVNKSLVSAEEWQNETRYHMLETINQYGFEKLKATGETDPIRDRHLKFFVKMAEETEPHLYASEQVEWFARAETEIDNVRAALDWSTNSIKTGDDKQIRNGLRLASVLTWVWQNRYIYEFTERLRYMLSQENAHAQTIERARALNTIGILQVNLNNFPDARPYLVEALVIGRKNEDQLTLGWTLCYLGWVLNVLGESDRGELMLEECVAVTQGFGNIGDTVTGIALSLLGDRYLARHDEERALKHYEESAKLLRQTYNTNLLAYAVRRLGFLVAKQTDYAKARTLFKESLTYNRNLGHQLGLTAALAGLARLDFLEGKLARAAQLYGFAETHLRAINQRLMVVDKSEFDNSVAALRAQLDAAIFEKAWGTGLSMTMEEAIVLAEET